MYLAYSQTYHGKDYSLRQSEYDTKSDSFIARDIFHLGLDPAKFIDDEGDGYFSFDEELVKAVKPFTSEEVDNVLEGLLFDFFSPEVKAHLERFPLRRSSTTSPLSQDDLANIEKYVDTFDIKRLYFIRYGAVDQTYLHKVHKKLMRPLASMSRDEREFHFINEEACLSPSERKKYVFAIFDLQRHFTQSFAAFLPEALSLDEMEESFLEEVCRLNKKQGFFPKEEQSQFLHHHLQRYVVMFFDTHFRRSGMMNAYVNEFMRGHRSFRWPEKKPQVDESRIQEVFGQSLEQLKKLQQDELGRLYRKLAKKLHPDKGGDPEKFVVLAEVYDQLTSSQS